jgi:hypothetical protein
MWPIIGRRLRHVVWCGVMMMMVMLRLLLLLLPLLLHPVHGGGRVLDGALVAKHGRRLAEIVAGPTDD